MIKRRWLLLIANLILIVPLFFYPCAQAANPTINLAVKYKTISINGQPGQAIVANDQFPASTLHFKEGDHVTLNVINHLDKGTTIHWHGLIVPWDMDGVEGVSQAPIPPGGVFHYRFTLKQSGTYWYHSHTGFQEQQGPYGAIIIDPAHPPAYHYDKDQVIILSDWSNTTPERIYANLKKEGDYYSSDFPLQPSLMRFWHEYRQGMPRLRQKLIEDYAMMQQMRMSIYDFSDVAYNAYLLNGHANDKPWETLVKPGTVVRLRFIAAGSGTIFHVKIPGATLQVVQMQGHDVKPYEVKDFTLAPGETLDALVKIAQDDPYIIYAESSNTSGAAVGALITHPNQQVNYHAVAPFPTPEPVNMMPGMNHCMSMASMSHDLHDMHGMNHPMSAGEEDPKTTSIKYQNVKALVPTNNPERPVHTIKMELSGYMGRYIWFINGVPEMDAKPIMIEPYERYRIVFSNNSMMHHPMHIHGHWFILRNGHGAFDPLLHTIDVAPGETVVADVDANASGQWIFHCHFLYHMMSGMTRVFRYSTFPKDIAKVKAQNPSSIYITPQMSHHPMGEMPTLYRASFIDVGNDPFKNNTELTFKTLIGSDFNKFELYTEDAEIQKGSVENADMDFFYWHLLGEFTAIKGGINYFYRPSGTPYWQPGVGIEHLFPYFIDMDLRAYYHSGSTKLNLEFSRDTQITNRFFTRLGIKSITATKTVAENEIGSGLNQLQYIVRPYYQLNPAWAIFTEYHHTYDYGPLANIRRNHGESTKEDTLTFGMTWLF